MEPIGESAVSGDGVGADAELGGKKLTGTLWLSSSLRIVTHFLGRQHETPLDKVRSLLGRTIRVQLSDRRVIEGEFQVILPCLCYSKICDYLKYSVWTKT
jgi:hypothetical protein